MFKQIVHLAGFLFLIAACGIFLIMLWTRDIKYTSADYEVLETAAAMLILGIILMIL